MAGWTDEWGRGDEGHTHLKPYLDLTLGQLQGPGQLPAFLLGHVCVEEELLLELHRLVLGVRFPLLPQRRITMRPIKILF